MVNVNPRRAIKGIRFYTIKPIHRLRPCSAWFYMRADPLAVNWVNIALISASGASRLGDMDEFLRVPKVCIITLRGVYLCFVVCVPETVFFVA